MTQEQKKKNQSSAQDTETQNQAGRYSSRWSGRMEDLLEQYQNREAFAYDVNQDPLYQHYKDSYIRGGKLAMEDTLGQAAALTGGYGSSYAQTAGQQAYNQYLEGLNDVAPQLYQSARDRYDQAGQNLLERYNLLRSQDELDYSRYQYDSELARYQVELMLQMGALPSEDLLTQSGLSPEYIAALLPASSGGSQEEKKGSSRKKTGQGENYLDAVLDLGYGPISSDTLWDLIQDGKVPDGSGKDTGKGDSSKEKTDTVPSLYEWLKERGKV